MFRIASSNYNDGLLLLVIIKSDHLNFLANPEAKVYNLLSCWVSSGSGYISLPVNPTKLFWGSIIKLLIFGNWNLEKALFLYDWKLFLAFSLNFSLVTLIWVFSLINFEFFDILMELLLWEFSMEQWLHKQINTERIILSWPYWAR